jgi:hypothetical protein
MKVSNHESGILGSIQLEGILVERLGVPTRNSVPRS